MGLGFRTQRLTSSDPLGLRVDRKIEDVAHGRMTVENVVEPDDVRAVSGLVVSTAQQLPITTLVGHQKDGTGLIEDVSADERCEFCHVPRLTERPGVQRRPTTERSEGVASSAATPC